MKGQTIICSAWLLFASGLVPVVALGQSNIDPEHKFAWSENIGWTNWQHDAPDSGDGVFVHPTYLGGFIWAENVGWINVGDGTPHDGVHYGNNDASDFGVNIDIDSVPPGDLFGMAWGENIGWINFDTREKGGQRARLDAPARRFRGFAWGENIGWINLDDDRHFVGILCDPCDTNCDGSIDLTDVEPFINLLLGGGEPCSTCAGDSNNDGSIDLTDVEPFIECLLG